jgi:hypothetical protein
VTKTFREIPIGDEFILHGRVYKKLALSLAEDEDRVGTVFQYEFPVEVVPPTPAGSTQEAGATADT